MNDSPSIFTKIINGDIPATIVYEDEHCIAIKDIHPKAPVHLLFIPRKEIPTVADVVEADEHLLGHLLCMAKRYAHREGINHYKLQFNVGQHGGQEVFHIHLHFLGYPQT